MAGGPAHPKSPGRATILAARLRRPSVSTGLGMVRRHRARDTVVKPPQQYEPHRVDRPPFDRAGRCRVAVRGCTRMLGLT